MRLETRKCQLRTVRSHFATNASNSLGNCGLGSKLPVGSSGRLGAVFLLRLAISWPLPQPLLAVSRLFLGHLQCSGPPESSEPREDCTGVE